jgi:hypothetical protein
MKKPNRFPITWDEREEYYDTDPTVEDMSDRMQWTMAIEAEGRVDLTDKNTQACLIEVLPLIPSQEELMYDLEDSLDALDQAIKQSRAA